MLDALPVGEAARGCQPEQSRALVGGQPRALGKGQLITSLHSCPPSCDSCRQKTSGAHRSGRYGMHLTSAQSSLIVAGIYPVFCMIEILRTQFFAKPEQSRHAAIVEIVSMFAVLPVTPHATILAVGALGHARFPAGERPEGRRGGD